MKVQPAGATSTLPSAATPVSAGSSSFSPRASSLPEKLTLEGTADRFWISSTTLSGLFRQKMGISFYQYILQRRVAEAKNLIYDQEPIEKIPGKVGFGDYSAFFRAFKKEVGISPRQFRKLIGSDPDRKDV